MGKQLMYQGAVFGKLTIVDIEVEDLGPRSHGRSVECCCECGELVNITAHQLMVGSRLCCGCTDPFLQPVSNEQLEICQKLSDYVGCHLGLAYHYLITGRTFAEAFIEFRAHREKVSTPAYGTRYRIGGAVSHFTIEELGARKGIFFKMNAVYDRVRCLCGQVLYFRDRHLRCGRAARCRCDYLAQRLNDRLKKSTTSQKRVVEHRQRDSLTPWRDAPKTHGPVCRKGPQGEGQCHRYSVGDDCLNYWAYGRATPHWKPGYLCYQPPSRELETRRDTFGDDTLVQNGGWTKP